MRRTKSNRPEPLAKAFTKDNQIYFRLQTALMEDVSYNSVIGRNLVNFAFLDQDLLERCMLEFFAVYVQRRDRGVHPDSIEEELVERSRRLFVRNSYLSIYLLGYVQFLMDEEIDPRIFSGITGDDKSLLNLIQREKPDGIPDALKSGMISVLIRSYESKRRRSEKALKIVWEASQGDTRTPVERYCKLEQEDSFFRKVNLHIIQCDTEIHEHVKLTSKLEVDRYLKEMVLKGFGGTDFRPIFEFVNEMNSAGEFTDFKGLIYFTDGYGTYPSKPPDYQTAFVFIDDEYNNYNVPSWAIKIILQSHEL